MNNNSYTVTLPNGNVVGFKGLKGVSGQLISAKDDLAKATRELAVLEFSYDRATVIAAVNSELAEQKGILDGMKESLALYQDILDTENGDFGKLTARYNELEETTETLTKQKDDLALQLEETLKPIRESQDSLAKENALELTVQFAVPEAIQDDFHRWIATSSDTWYMNIASQAVLVDGKYTYPKGIEAKDTKANLYTNLRAFIDNIEANKIIAEGQLTAYESQKAQYAAEYARYIKEDGTGLYDVAVKAWSDAKAAYAKAYDAGNYSDPQANDRAKAIDNYKAYEEEYTAASTSGNWDAAIESALKQKYMKMLKPYFDSRKALDGFVPVDNGVAIQACEYETEWDKLANLTDEQRFGKDIAGGYINYTAGAEDLYSVYVDAAKELGYTWAINPASNAAQQVEKTYEEWLDTQTSISYPYSVSSANIQDRTFSAKYNAEYVTALIANQASWKELMANAENDYAEISEKYLAAVNKGKELQLATDAALAARAAELAKIDEQLAGISNIQMQIQSMLNSELGTSGSSFENLIAWVESEVLKLQGGNAGIGNGDYFFNTTGSIPAQEQVVASYQALLDDLNKGDESTYKPAQERAIEAKKAEIEWYQAYADALDALFNHLNDLKNQYIAGMTGE